MEYVRLSKSREFKYACNSHLYSQYSKKTGVMYLKCDTADCKGTAQIDQGLLVQYMQIPRRPIYCQNPLLADSITCKFIQPEFSLGDASSPKVRIDDTMSPIRDESRKRYNPFKFTYIKAGFGKKVSDENCIFQKLFIVML